MEVYIIIPIFTALLVISVFLVRRCCFARRVVKERTLAWFFEKSGSVLVGLTRSNDYKLVHRGKSTEFPHFMKSNCTHEEKSTKIGLRFFCMTFFSDELRRCEGCVYFGPNLIGPSKIVHGINAVHGGASVAFTLEQMQVFALQIDKKKESENIYGVLLHEISIRYFKPIPIDSVQKFEIFEDEDGVIIGRLRILSDDDEEEGTIFVECKGRQSSSHVTLKEKSMISSVYHEHYDSFHLHDEYPPEVKNDIHEKVISSKNENFEYEEMFVYPTDDPKKYKRRHLPRRRFMNTPEFQHVGIEEEFLKNRYVFYRIYKSTRPSDDNSILREEEKTISYLFFGSDSCDESGEYVHDGAVCGIFDVITAWTCILFTPSNYSCFTKNLNVKLLERERRIKRYQVLRMECKYIFDAELVRGGRKRRYGIVEGSLFGIGDEDVVYTTVVAHFTSIEKTK